MKKFLTLALALVMALAIAAPAMAFVEFEYSTASDYTLDFYLVDYDDSSRTFASGVFTELPAADRGYVKNETVGAVVEVFVPAGSGANKVDLTITSKNVRLRGTCYPSTSVGKLVNATGVAYGYSWAAPAGVGQIDDEMRLVGPTTDTDRLRNDAANAKDVTAAFFVMGRVLSDEASLTATLANSFGNFNQKLGTPSNVGAANATKAEYKIGNNEYDVFLAKKADGNGYVYTIAPKGGTSAKAVYIYTNLNFESQSMVVTAGNNKMQTGTDGTKAVYTVTTALDTDGMTFSVDGKIFKLDATDADNGANADEYTSATALISAMNAFVGAKGWTAAADDPSTITKVTFTANAVGVAGSATGPLNIDVKYHASDIAQATSLVLGTSAGCTDGTPNTITAVGVGRYLVDGSRGLHYATYAAGVDPRDTAPTAREEGTTPDADATSYLNQVLADFSMNPALVNNVLKPEYLGQYRRGNVIDEITLEIQPWQAYVSIPDIEVIDPPKTGDAATLAGFVMIVLAAAGVVVFKKVRA